MNPPSFHFSTSRTVLFGLLVLLAGCTTIYSDNPLSDPETAKPDEKLMGEWMPKPVPKENYLRLNVKKMDAPGYPSGTMKLILTPFAPGGTPVKGGAIRAGVIVATEAEGKTFVNLCGRAIEEPAELPAWEKLRAQGFSILKYSVAQDTLKLWYVGDESPLKTAVKNGKLKGKFQPAGPGGFGPTVHVTDTGAKLSRLLSNEEAHIFSGRPEVLARVK
jgi:hypothetical protein